MILDEQCESARKLLPCICCGFLTADFGHFFFSDSSGPRRVRNCGAKRSRNVRSAEEADKDTSAEAPPARGQGTKVGTVVLVKGRETYGKVSEMSAGVKCDRH